MAKAYLHDGDHGYGAQELDLDDLSAVCGGFRRTSHWQEEHGDAGAAEHAYGTHFTPGQDGQLDDDDRRALLTAHFANREEGSTADHGSSFDLNQLKAFGSILSGITSGNPGNAIGSIFNAVTGGTAGNTIGNLINGLSSGNGTNPLGSIFSSLTGGNANGLTSLFGSLTGNGTSTTASAPSPTATSSNDGGFFGDLFGGGDAGDDGGGFGFF